MHNAEYVLENDTHKLLWNFEIQTDHLISARRPDLVIINKKERACRIMDLAVSKKSPGDLRRLTVIQAPVRNYRLTLV